MNTLRGGLLLIAGLVASLAAPAIANPLKSLYTTIELKDCETLKTGAVGSAWSMRTPPRAPT